MDISRDIELEKRIDVYIKGNLSQEEIDTLWIDLLEKPEYIDLLQTEIDVARIHQAQKKERPAILHYWKWVAAAAAIILVVTSIHFFTGDAQKPLHKWAQKEITLSENLASAEVNRSASAITTADSLLNAGFMEALDGNRKEAVRIYRRIAETSNTPQVRAKAHLNLGIIGYNEQRFEHSIQNFNRAIAYTQDDLLLQERAYWYIGNAFINLGRLQDARTAIREAYTLGNIYKDEALKLLEKLEEELNRNDIQNQFNDTQ